MIRVQAGERAFERPEEEVPPGREQRPAVGGLRCDAQVDERNRVGQAFLDRFEARYGRRPAHSMPGLCHDVATVIARGLAAARPLTGEGVKHGGGHRLLATVTGRPPAERFRLHRRPQFQVGIPTRTAVSPLAGAVHLLSAPAGSPRTTLEYRLPSNDPHPGMSARRAHTAFTGACPNAPLGQLGRHGGEMGGAVGFGGDDPNGAHVAMALGPVVGSAGRPEIRSSRTRHLGLAGGRPVALHRFVHPVPVDEIPSALSQQKDVLMALGGPVGHTIGHGIGLGPNAIASEIPTVFLQREGHAPGNAQEVLRLEPGRS